MFRTLDQMNADAEPRVWDEYLVIDTYAVGGMGHSFSQYRTGVKVHMIRVTTIIDVDEDIVAEKSAKYPTYRPAPVGRVISTTAFCNGNGSGTGRVVAGWDTDKVNCKNCGA